MNKLLQHHSLIRENLAVLIGLCLCFYFSYHAVQGNRSFMRLMMLERGIAVTQQQYNETLKERMALETKVKAMRPGSISRDLLEERVRSVLGYRQKDELELNSN